MNLLKEKKFWLIGGFVSALGLLTVKIIAPLNPANFKIINIIGITLALAGLVIITFGTRKKNK